MDNTVSMQCSNHRMGMTSLENFYQRISASLESQTPYKTEVTYQCTGSCKQTDVQTILPKGVYNPEIEQPN